MNKVVVHLGQVFYLELRYHMEKYSAIFISSVQITYKQEHNRSILGKNPIQIKSSNLSPNLFTLTKSPLISLIICQKRFLRNQQLFDVATTDFSFSIASIHLSSTPSCYLYVEFRYSRRSGKLRGYLFTISNIIFGFQNFQKIENSFVCMFLDDLRNSFQKKQGWKIRKQKTNWRFKIFDGTISEFMGAMNRKRVF